MNTPQRDTKESEFSKILAAIEDSCNGFETIVFFDSEGETIDYHSCIDPYDTRLTAAYLGVVISSAIYRFNFLELGDVKYMEFVSDKKEILTVSIGDDLFVGLVLKAGSLTKEVYTAMDALIVTLRMEVGI